MSLIRHPLAFGSLLLPSVLLFCSAAHAEVIYEHHQIEDMQAFHLRVEVDAASCSPDFVISQANSVSATFSQCNGHRFDGLLVNSNRAQMTLTPRIRNDLLTLDFPPRSAFTPVEFAMTYY